MHSLVIQREMHIRHSRQGIRRRARKGDHRHADIFRNPRFIQHLFRFTAAGNGDKHLIARRVAQKDISAITGPGDKRRFS
ncbi:hypothetical protein D3C78_1514900 [compost metagenome]